MADNRKHLFLKKVVNKQTCTMKDFKVVNK